MNTAESKMSISCFTYRASARLTIPHHQLEIDDIPIKITQRPFYQLKRNKYNRGCGNGSQVQDADPYWVLTTVWNSSSERDRTPFSVFVSICTHAHTHTQADKLKITTTKKITTYFENNLYTHPQVKYNQKRLRKPGCGGSALDS